MLKGTLDFFNLIYPVGSVYPTFDGNFNPNTSWGGTWEKLNDTFLYATNTISQVGTTGGEASVTLSIDEMPAHSHNYTEQGHTALVAGYVYKTAGDNVAISSSGYALEGLGIAGSSQAHNNMPPYTKVIMWRRTA